MNKLAYEQGALYALQTLGLVKTAQGRMPYTYLPKAPLGIDSPYEGVQGSAAGGHMGYGIGMERKGRGMTPAGGAATTRMEGNQISGLISQQPKSFFQRNMPVEQAAKLQPAPTQRQPGLAEMLRNKQYGATGWRR